MQIQTQIEHIYGYSWKVDAKKRILINNLKTNKVILIFYESLIN